MAASKGIILCTANSTLAATTPVTWQGGFAALVITATTYPTTCFLQVLGIDGQTWINLAPATVTATPTTISANSAFGYNLPAGQFRLNLSGGSVSNMNAALAAVTFD